MNYISTNAATYTPFSEKTTIPERIDSIDFNRIWTNYSIDTAIILRRLEEIYNSMSESLEESKVNTKQLESYIYGLKQEVNALALSSNYVTSYASNIILGTGTRLSSAQSVQLDIKSTVDYVANGMVKDIKVVKHPKGSSWDFVSSVPVYDVNAVNKTAYYVEDVYTSDQLSYNIPDFLNGETLTGPVFDFYVTFYNSLPINYFYLTPFGATEVTISIYFYVYENNTWTWKWVYTGTSADNFEAVLDTTYSTDRALVRIYSKNPSTGVHEITKPSQLKQILQEMIISEYPTTDKLKKFAGATDETTITKKYSIGFYSIRFGVRSFVKSGTCYSPIFVHQTPITGTVRINGTNPDKINATIFGNTSEMERQFIYPTDISMVYDRSYMAFYPSKTENGFTFPGKFIELSAFKVDNEDGVIITDMSDLLPYTATNNRQACVYGGAIFLNFDAADHRIEIYAKYVIDSFSIIFQLTGNGYNTPMLYSYEVQVD